MTHHTINHDRDRTPRYLSAQAIAAVLGTSTSALFAWLRFGHDLGVRFELLPLLPVAYDQLVDEDRATPRPSSSRERLVLTEDGVQGIDIEDSDEHARIDRHWEAIALALLTDDDGALRRFDGLSVCGVPLAAARGQLQAWADATSSRLAQ